MGIKSTLFSFERVFSKSTFSWGEKILFGLETNSSQFRSWNYLWLSNHEFPLSLKGNSCYKTILLNEIMTPFMIKLFRYFSSVPWPQAGKLCWKLLGWQIKLYLLSSRIPTSSTIGHKAINMGCIGAFGLDMSESMYESYCNVLVRYQSDYARNYHFCQVSPD